MPSEPAKAIHLWPDGPPKVLDPIRDEIEFVIRGSGVGRGTRGVRNISNATLTMFSPEPAKANGHGVIVVPGGGWVMNAIAHEGVDAARWLADEGFTAFLLKYRVLATTPDEEKYFADAAASEEVGDALLAAGRLPDSMNDLLSPEMRAARAVAADDGRRAIALAREHTSTLGMLGFSAGAFMAVDIALDPRAPQLAWIAPIYGGETSGAPVPDDAPPMFSAVAQDDILFKICEGLHRDWIEAGRSAEHHVFRRGQHGFGMVKQGLPSDRWTDLFLAWVRDLVAA